VQLEWIRFLYTAIARRFYVMGSLAALPVTVHNIDGKTTTSADATTTSSTSAESITKRSASVAEAHAGALHRALHRYTDVTHTTSLFACDMACLQMARVPTVKSTALARWRGPSRSDPT
jgi:hypothetical protein